MSLSNTNKPLTAIEAFRACLKDCTTSTPPPPLSCGSSYVRVSKLKQWLKSETTHGDFRTTQTTRLLEYAYRKRSRVPIEKTTLFHERNPCILVFATLLAMDWGWLVHEFHSIHLTDAKLPIDLATLRITFRNMASRRVLENSPLNPDDLAHLFNTTQWQFCPAKFNGGYELYWEKEIIIPIQKKVRISEKGGTAKLWQIAVLEEFVGKELRQKVPHAKYNDPEDDLGPRYHFALKVFEHHNSQIFEDERSAFETLHGHNGLVQYLGGYTHRVNQLPPVDTNISQNEEAIYKYNILLEYGERDLGLLFAEKLPPVLQDDIQAFWKNLFAVAKAVKDMHDFKTNNDGITKIYSGWHADIKPDNILEIQGKFWLADPGFAKFVERAKENSESDPVTNLTGGTHTYGAPERYPGRKKQNGVNQTTDIWSLGCVFSIAATWVVLGAEGIKQYQRLRSKAIQFLIELQDATSSSKASQLRLERGDYFHNGFTVLQEVRDWHTYLRNSVRITDEITPEVLDLLNQPNGMLVGDPQMRMKSKEVCKHLDRISEGLSSPASNVPTSISDFLRDGDDQSVTLNLAQSSVRTITEPGLPPEPKPPRQERRDKFLNFLDKPLMDNYRSYLKPAAARPVLPRGEHQSLSDFADRELPIRLHSGSSSLGQSTQYSNHSLASPPTPERLNSSTTGFIGISGQSEGSRDFRYKRKKEQPQDMFQAREDMNAKEIRRREKDVFSRLKSRPKDSKLAKYWGDRDLKFIVDNAESMEKHWGKVRYLLETLLLKADGLDPDGVDLVFTLGGVKVDSLKDKKTIDKIMKTLDNSDNKPVPGAHTSMQTPLKQIFAEYFKRLTPHAVKKSKVTIIVLTDGLWEGMLNKEEVNQEIVGFARELERRLGYPPSDRPLSIEFVQFGKDLEATFRLKRLDNELQNEGIIDIVDTEHCDGDVNKMLLGSFVETYDEMEDDDEACDPISPSQRSSYYPDQYSIAEYPLSAGQPSYTSPTRLPRSHTLETNNSSRNTPVPQGDAERPNHVPHYSQ